MSLKMPTCAHVCTLQDIWRGNAAKASLTILIISSFQSGNLVKEGMCRYTASQLFYTFGFWLFINAFNQK